MIDREKAEIGVLICLEEPTKPMRTEAAGRLLPLPGLEGAEYPRLQLLTMAELLEGKGVAYPPAAQVNVTYKKAPKAKRARAEQLEISALLPNRPG